MNHHDPNLADETVERVERWNDSDTATDANPSSPATDANHASDTANPSTTDARDARTDAGDVDHVVDPGRDDECDAGEMQRQMPNLARKIVVAVDGSPESAAALRWARDFVETSGGEVAVLTAYAVPLAVMEAPFVHSDMYREADAAATEHVASLIEQTFGHRQIPHLVALGPIEQLVERHCWRSEMIVVGTRARRRWTDRWRASTTNRITGAVDVPVISVPGGHGQQTLAA